MRHIEVRGVGWHLVSGRSRFWHAATYPALSPLTTFHMPSPSRGGGPSSTSRPRSSSASPSVSPIQPGWARLLRFFWFVVKLERKDPRGSRRPFASKSRVQFTCQRCCASSLPTATASCRAGLRSSMRCCLACEPEREHPGPPRLLDLRLAP
jgi:hypothetical protein